MGKMLGSHIHGSPATIERFSGSLKPLPASALRRKRGPQPSTQVSSPFWRPPVILSGASLRHFCRRTRDPHARTQVTATLSGLISTESLRTSRHLPPFVHPDDETLYLIPPANPNRPAGVPPKCQFNGSLRRQHSRSQHRANQDIRVEHQHLLALPGRPFAPGLLEVGHDLVFRGSQCRDQLLHFLAGQPQSFEICLVRLGFGGNVDADRRDPCRVMATGVFDSR